MLAELSRPFGEIKTTSSADLEHVRALIGKLKENNPVKKVNSNSSGEVESNEESVKRSTSPSPVVSPNDNWCFVDSVTAIRFFRIDRAQENLHYVLDICDTTGLYILDDEEEEVDGHDEDGKDAMKVGMDANMSSTLHKLSIESKYQVYKDTEANQPSPITKHQGGISSVMRNVNHCGDTSKTHQDRFNEKTTEGILKAARLGDLKMLTELHREGSSIFL